MRLASLAWILMGGMALTQAAGAWSQSTQLSGTRAALAGDVPVAGREALPPVPAGTSTIFGGAIRKIDPVRDQILLDIYGQRPMKILFDERTQVYRDGVKIPLHDLRTAEHASVQTTLDGTHIFAISVHILSQLPQGDYEGRVLRYRASSGELELDASPSPQPFKVIVARNATFTRKGQSAFTDEGSGPEDLRPGSLVEVTFSSRVGELGLANQVVVLAVPGSSFVFSGRVSALDMSEGRLVLVDPRDDKSYQILFNPILIPNSQGLRVGQNLRVTASYNGRGYMASDVTAY